MMLHEVIRDKPREMTCICYMIYDMIWSDLIHEMIFSEGDDKRGCSRYISWKMFSWRFTRLLYLISSKWTHFETITLLSTLFYKSFTKVVYIRDDRFYDNSKHARHIVSFVIRFSSSEVHLIHNHLIISFWSSKFRHTIEIRQMNSFYCLQMLFIS